MIGLGRAQSTTIAIWPGVERDARGRAGSRVRSAAMSVRTEDFAHAGLEQPPSPPPARDGPRRLTDPREDPRVRAKREAELETAREAERRRLRRLRYSVAALIVVDVIAGTWIYLHAPEALPS